MKSIPHGSRMSKVARRTLDLRFSPSEPAVCICWWLLLWGSVLVVELKLQHMGAPNILHWWASFWMVSMWFSIWILSFSLSVQAWALLIRKHKLLALLTSSCITGVQSRLHRKWSGSLFLTFCLLFLICLQQWALTGEGRDLKNRAAREENHISKRRSSSEKHALHVLPLSLSLLFFRTMEICTFPKRAILHRTKWGDGDAPNFVLQKLFGGPSYPH